MAGNRAIKPTKVQGEPVESYVLTTIPKPTASANNVVVRILLRPVNPTDLIPSRLGFWAHLDLNDVVVGAEGMGVVEEVGEGVSTVKVGQRVIPLIFDQIFTVGHGTWRDYLEVPEADIIHVPDNIPDDIAAQFVVTPWTAYGLIQWDKIPKGEYVVQSAAGSFLGRQLISLAKYYGVKTINVVRRDDWIKPLTEQGADYVINSSKEDVEAKVKEITGGKGAYMAFDSVAGESTRLLASCVRDSGKVLVYGMMSATEVTVDIKDLSRLVIVSFFRLNDLTGDLEHRKETTSAIWELLEKKIIDPLIGKTYPFAEFKEAIKESERSGRGGKVFLSSD